MYVEFFGLKHNPFRARATAGEVFVGPQQATLMSGLKKALAASDAVVTVSGPVGVGKTTIVARVMDTVSSQKAVARIGRMQLGREEILELLLSEFDVSRHANSTLQRFGAFKRLLNDREDQNIRVFIVVEDAQFLGVDALAELESLTSADTGETNGANIVLMGPPDLRELLNTPRLVRLKQRVRLRQSIAPFTTAEIRGYLAHRIREAGGDFGAMFAPDSLDAIHRCSEGIPRVINNLCGAALTAAADAKAAPVSADLITRLARDEFGFEPELPPPTPEPTSDAVKEQKAVPAKAPPARPAPAAKTAQEAKPEVKAEAPPAKEEFEVPELIQDTLPEFEALKVPEEKKTPAQEMAALRDKTDNTEPSLPVLDIADPQTPAEPGALDGLDAAALAAEQQRILLEPHAPEPLSKTSDPADTQTIKALDSALRPDTQLLEALDEPVPEIEDLAPVPLGLQDGSPQTPSPVATETQDAAQANRTDETESGTGTETLPTLSESMRLESPPTAAPIPPEQAAAAAGQAPKKPNIDALEAALAVARKGPIDLNTAPEAPPATATPVKSAPAAPPPPTATGNEVPQASAVPEITLDHSIERQQEAARARLAAEAAKLAAAAEAKEEAEVDEHQLAAAAEFAAEQERLAGMSSIAEQFSAGSELTIAEPAVANASIPAASEPTAQQDERQARDNGKDRIELEKVAANLGSARTLEEIDDMAAETLFGEEFSQIAAQIQAMAANDKQMEDEPDGDTAGTAEPLAAPATPVPDPAPDPVPDPVPNPVRNPVPAVPKPAPSNGAAVPPTAVKSMPRGKPDIDASAARRLEMVRSLNENRRPVVNAPAGEEIVLGDADSSPTSNAKTPEPIENQFGTSMTANLKALSETSIQAMQEADEVEDKKGGVFDRFKRS